MCPFKSRTTLFVVVTVSLSVMSDVSLICPPATKFVTKSADVATSTANAEDGAIIAVIMKTNASAVKNFFISASLYFYFKPHKSITEQRELCVFVDVMRRYHFPRIMINKASRSLLRLG